jgi:CubicO group peptidase (beta-lactamase class C family)
MTTIHGTFAQPFEPVRDEFARNFAERGEVGAAVCVLHDGQPVVDLWGGVADRATGRPWERDTLVVVYSSTKGAVAFCAGILLDRGQLDLDAPVARYWPEFAQNGKAGVTVRMLLTHQAGLAAPRTPLKPGGLYDWDYFVGQLAAEAPAWEPGTRQGYHASTFGQLVGELVRRVSGRPLADFLRAEIIGPLGLDFHLGLPAGEEGRVAPVARPDLPARGEVPHRFLEKARTEPDSLQGLSVRNTGRLGQPREHESPISYRAVLPSGGGIGHARSLAGLYEPLALGGSAAGRRFVDADTLAALGKVQSATACDALLLIGLRVGLGFWKSSDNRAAPPGARDGIILSETAFGHPGMGGSLGFADPAYRLAFGYVMNKQGPGVGLNPRGQALVDAVYRCLGCTSDRSGSWR